MVADVLACMVVSCGKNMACARNEPEFDLQPPYGTTGSEGQPGQQQKFDNENVKDKTAEEVMPCQTNMSAIAAK